MPESSWKHRHIPMLVTCLREGYGGRSFLADLGAGLTVAIIALPLAMALGIASIPQNVADELAAVHPWLTPPAMGLFTVVVAGLLTSLLGGSRVQIGGPTAAFMPLVFGICAAHGYAGLVLATTMAGVILVLLGVFRFGGIMKFVPYPVVTGFTAGIGVVILASQIKDFLGLTIVDDAGHPMTIPAEFIEKLELFWAHLPSWSWRSTAVAATALAMLEIMRRIAPRVPGAIVAVVATAAAVKLLGWSTAPEAIDGAVWRPLVETVGTRFGGIPSSLPSPQLPELSPGLIRELIPAATAIAFLGAIESLLSAVVADGMTGFRHRSDQELVAQGVANVGSALFMGLPATGAIARTAANVRSGGTTPVAGILHALIVLLCMVALAPLAKEIPLPTLAAILVVVAWRVSELQHLRAYLKAPRRDVLVMATTFFLTVIFDLTVGVGVGIVLASLLFMHRMAEVSTVAGVSMDDEEERTDPKDPGRMADRRVPAGVVVYEINGPFFFGAANKLRDVLDRLERPARAIILRLRSVPHIDATGLNALREFHRACAKRGTTLLLGGVHAHPLNEIVKADLDREIGLENIFESLDAALERARELTEPAPGIKA